MNPQPTASMWRTFAHMWRNDHLRGALRWSLLPTRRALMSAAGTRRKIEIWRTKKMLAVPFREPPEK